MERTKNLPSKDLIKIPRQGIKLKIQSQNGEQYLVISIPMQNIPRLEQLNLDIGSTIVEAGNTRDEKPSNKKTTVKSDFSKKNIPYLPFARKLHKAVHDCGQLKKGKDDQIQINRWARDFRLLHERDKITTERIRDVLNWYIFHIGELYIPEAYSASSFRDKFLRIEKAVQRKNTQAAEKRKLMKKYKEYDGIKYHYNPDDGEYYSPSGHKWID